LSGAVSPKLVLARGGALDDIFFIFPADLGYLGKGMLQ
jgi:hypothetical protein